MKPTSASAMDNSLTMESLALPQELYWNGKLEPTSPLSSELFALNETTSNCLYDDNFANGLIILNEESMDMKQSLDLYHGDEDIIIELCNLKEEYLLDSKLHAPLQLLDSNIGIDIANLNQIIKVQNINELNSFGASNFDTAILTQLTPPQSPPQNHHAATISPTTYEQLYNGLSESRSIHTHAFQQQQQQQSPSPVSYTSSPCASPPTVATPQHFNFNAWNNNNIVNNNNNNSNTVHVTADDDIQRETQIVDEILNSRVKEWTDWNDEDCESQSSSFSAPSSQSDSNTSTDDDWLPGNGAGSCYSSSGSSPMHHYSSEENLQANIDSKSGSSALSASAKKRTRPYGRGIEDRKKRKKEQNKNAATRYRQKKKLEMECVLSEELVLIQRNDELKRELAERKHEAKYLKTLIREFHNNQKKK